MRKVVVYLKNGVLIAGGALLLLMVIGLGSALLPNVTALRLKAGNDFGVEEICANLMKGDYAAASEFIARKTPKRELRFADAIVWLARKGDSPFALTPGSQLFTELPADQGPPRSCARAMSVTLAGDQLSTSLYLGYPDSRVTVTLRYAPGFFSTPLQTIEIGPTEPVTPATPPPGETDRRMLQFMKDLEGK